jgi:hypothetical protein
VPRPPISERPVRRRDPSDTETEASCSVEEAVDLYVVGLSLARIANHFGGISPTTVARALRRRGVPLRLRRVTPASSTLLSRR